MFDDVLDEEAPPAGVSVGEDWFDPAWLDQVPEPEASCRCRSVCRRGG